MKKMTWVCVALFLTGILCTQLIGYDKLRELTKVDGTTLLQYANSNTELVQRYFNVLWERGKLFLLLWICSMTTLGRRMPVLVLWLCCFLLGLFGGICMVGVGWPGILLALASLFPQILLYGAAVWIILWMRNSQIRQFIYGKKLLAKRILHILIAIVLIILGTIMETTVGHQLVCQVINLVIS